MYTDEMAEELKKDAGKKWRPANGTEGDMFQEMYCDKCRINPCHCSILSYSFYYNITDKLYPTELQIGKDGQPTCTKFEKI